MFEIALKTFLAFHVAVLSLHLLVEEDDVWSPDFRRRDLQFGDVGVLSRIPDQAGVIPPLVETNNKVLIKWRQISHPSVSTSPLHAKCACSSSDGMRKIVLRYHI